MIGENEFSKKTEGGGTYVRGKRVAFSKVLIGGRIEFARRFRAIVLGGRWGEATLV